MFSSNAWLALLLVFVIYIITLFINRPDGFWIADDAIKYLQSRSIIDQHYSNFSLSWPGAAIDTKYQFQPIPSPFSVVRNNKLYAVFSPVFALLSTIPYKLLGYPGLYIIPLVASLFLLLGIARITSLMSTQARCSHYAVFIAALCTPIWFYSVVYWEHTAAVALCIWSLFFMFRFHARHSRRDLIVSMLLAGLGIYFRDELYLWCALLCITSLVFTPDRRLKNMITCILTLCASIIPLWVFQWIALGTPFGYHLGTHLFSASGITEHLSKRPLVFYNMLIASYPSRLLSLVIAVPLLILFFIRSRINRALSTMGFSILCIIAVISSVIFLSGLHGAKSPIMYLLQASNGFLVSAPVIILAFLKLSSREEGKEAGDNTILERWVWVLCLGYPLLYTISAPALGSNGIHWGNRFLLIVYPLLSILCAINIWKWLWETGNKKIWRIIPVVIILLLSFISQLKSIDLLHKKKDFSYRLNKIVSEKAEKMPMITYLPWVPTDLTAVFFRNMIFLVRSQEQMNELLSKLSQRGYDRFIYISSINRQYGRPVTASIDDPGLNFFGLDFTVYAIPKTSINSK